MNVHDVIMSCSNFNQHHNTSICKTQRVKMDSPRNTTLLAYSQPAFSLSPFQIHNSSPSEWRTRSNSRKREVTHSSAPLLHGHNGAGAWQTSSGPRPVAGEPEESLIRKALGPRTPAAYSEKGPGVCIRYFNCISTHWNWKTHISWAGRERERERERGRARENV